LARESKPAAVPGPHPSLFPGAASAEAGGPAPDAPPPGDQQAAPAPDFERALAELERLVERLESGDLPLDEALQTFERGVALTRHCQMALKAAQQKVEILLKRNGEPGVEPFTISEDDPTGAS
jgi:exodeoxyribonuclease VII small subunit